MKKFDEKVSKVFFICFVPDGNELMNEEDIQGDTKINRYNMTRDVPISRATHVRHVNRHVLLPIVYLPTPVLLQCDNRCLLR